MITINNKDYKVFGNVETIEEVFCLGTLIATKTLRYDATLSDSYDYYKSLGQWGCGDCPHKDICLACIINE